MAAQIKIYQDGPYLVNGGQELVLDGCAVLVRADGGVTLRFDPVNVTLADTPLNNSIYDYNGATSMLARAVATSGLTIAEIDNVNHEKAGEVAAFMIAQSWLQDIIE